MIQRGLGFDLKEMKDLCFWIFLFY